MVYRKHIHCLCCTGIDFGFSLPLLPTTVPPLMQLMLLQGLLIAAGVPLLQQLPHRIRQQVGGWGGCGQGMYTHM